MARKTGKMARVVEGAASLRLSCLMKATALGSVQSLIGTIPYGCSMSQPQRFCRRPAYDLFVAQLLSLEQTDSLVRAAVAASMHELDDADAEPVLATLDEIAAEVRGRVQSRSASALIARLHQVLFDEYGFTGNVDDYYNPHNSYLSKVLATRRGIPVTLSLVYKSVAQRVGLAVRGINAPAHFLTATEVDGQWMIVDPFDGGRMLTREEVLKKVEMVSPTGVDLEEDSLATATHGQWLARIIRNLVHVFGQQSREADSLAMQELLALVEAREQQP